MDIAGDFSLRIISNVDKTIKREKIKEKRIENNAKFNSKAILKVLKEIVRPDNYKHTNYNYANKVCMHSSKTRELLFIDQNSLILELQDCHSKKSKNLYTRLEKEMDKIDRHVWDVKGLSLNIKLETKYFDVIFKCYHPAKYDTKNSEKTQGYYQFLIEICPKTELLFQTKKSYYFQFTFNKLIWNCGEFVFPITNCDEKHPKDYTFDDVNNEYNKFANFFNE